MWNPTQYLQFQQERDRPFFDLLAQVPEPGRGLVRPLVVDLGCGTGHLTAALADRWPHAEVSGIDSSPEMLAQAAQHERPGLSFVQADLRHWEPPAPVDVLLSNAALQWVDGHDTLIPELARRVAPGGVFAFQVPGNFDAPSHTLLAEVLSRPRWQAVRHESRDKAALGAFGPAEYAGLLAPLGFRVNAWETTYLHLLPRSDSRRHPVLEWVRGTALRPVLAALPSQDTEAFLDEYGEALAGAYPVQSYGTPLPFRRVFVVAERQRPAPA